MTRLLQRYGPSAVVAGGSEGIGAAFARALARAGFDVVVVARRPDPLKALAGELHADHGVMVRTLTVDLAVPEAPESIVAAWVDLDVGLVVLAAAATSVGPFLEVPLADKLRIIDTNCAAPLALAHHFGLRLKERGCGGIIFMSSLAGLYGGPFVATYAATKAFDLILAESISGELGPYGIDVLACVAGPTRTPTWERNAAPGPMPMDPVDVAAAALAGLGKRPRVVPGMLNRTTQWIVRQLPRRFVVARVATATRTSTTRGGT